MLFICYTRCSTCQKARKWLDENGVSYEWRDIKGQNPTAEELAVWQEKSGLPMKKFFNTSGMLYREMNLKDRLKNMSDEEMLQLLATDGMLVKRPILVDGDKVLLGFKEEQYKEKVYDDKGYIMLPCFEDHVEYSILFSSEDASGNFIVFSS